ncbi:hypothetical protein IFR05_011328 [Cadophora sp. M221]|nr:hypothetical protein IFR05_011328 [Cadophora sp. M221]
MATNGTSNGNGTSGIARIEPEQVAKLGMAAYRAPSLLQPHRAQDALQDAHDGRIPPLIGFFCGLACPPVAKVVAQLGFDIVWIDWEHASMNVETMTQMVHDVQFFSEGKSMAFVRVPGHGHENIGFALDAGASIVVPQVDTVEQARHIVSAARYGAIRNGTRSAPPARYLPGISDTPLDPSLTFHENVNKQAAIVIQIETYTGIQNLDAILTECGDEISSVWLGSLDARISMGFSGGGLGGNEPEWLDAVALYESTLAKHNMPASGLAMGTPESKAAMGRGKSFVVVAAETFAIMGAGLTELGYFRENFPKRNHKGVYKQL